MLDPLGWDPYGRPSKTRRPGRLRRSIPSILCLAGAVVLMALIGDADVDQGNLWAIPALALTWTAVTLPAWRAGGTGDIFEGRPERVFRLHFRLHLRAMILLADVALVFWWVASYAHFEGSDEYGTTNPAVDAARFSTWIGWTIVFFVAAALPLLLAPLTWRLWPASVRMAVRDARLTAKFIEQEQRFPGYPRR